MNSWSLALQLIDSDFHKRRSLVNWSFYDGCIKLDSMKADHANLILKSDIF
jgi:hypothetical protein